MADLKPRQYKRLGRIEERNPERAARVAERMNKRATRTERGKEVANRVQEGKGVARKAVSQYRRAEERPRTERAQAMSKEEFEKRKSALNKSAGRDTPLSATPKPNRISPFTNK
jgi:hypothetical protein